MCRQTNNTSNVTATMLVFTLTLGVVVAQTFRSDEGPYQTVISNVTVSSADLERLQVNVSVYTIKGRSLVRGTIYVKHEVKDLKFRVLMYYFEDKKVKVFDLKNQNCRNAIIEVILKALAVPFNKHSCKVATGTYKFAGLDVDALLHSVVQSLWYGAAQIRLELFTRTKPLCYIDVHYHIAKPNNE